MPGQENTTGNEEAVILIDAQILARSQPDAPERPRSGARGVRSLESPGASCGVFEPPHVQARRVLQGRSAASFEDRGAPGVAAPCKYLRGNPSGHGPQQHKAA
jgi:hypothetical protein